MVQHGRDGCQFCNKSVAPEVAGREGDLLNPSCEPTKVGRQVERDFAPLDIDIARFNCCSVPLCLCSRYYHSITSTGRKNNPAKVLAGLTNIRNTIYKKSVIKNPFLLFCF